MRSEQAIKEGAGRSSSHMLGHAEAWALDHGRIIWVCGSPWHCGTTHWCLLRRTTHHQMGHGGPMPH
jgi:hypothetical protein